MANSDLAILIPAYNPDERLIKLIKGLVLHHFYPIIVVNDGSKEDCEEIFEEVKKVPQCTLLKHAVNLGKGRTLKTGFNHILNEYGSKTGVVTVDADGQHALEDILRVAREVEENPDKLTTGGRNFYKENIPFRSRFGNLLTKKIFSFLTGVQIQDTQTGLRGFPMGLIHEMLTIPGERFEYEMKMLMECNQHKIPIHEIEIQTIYIDENKTSSFNPLFDSVSIYMVFVKFLGSSLASFGVDILSFMLLISIFKSFLPEEFLIIASIGSRILSSLFNYFINRHTVFSAKVSTKESIVKYYILALVQMGLSTAGVYWIYSIFQMGEVPIKMGVDLFLFFISFRVQREWVFKRKCVQKAEC